VDNEGKDNLFIIAKGKCKVQVSDRFVDRYETLTVNILKPGDHFGEISMLYSCPRSATIISLNYCTLGVINRTRYSDLLTIHPNLN